MIQNTKTLVENTINQAIERAKSANSAFRTHDDVAVELPGGMFGHVRNGRLISFGLEPVGDVFVDHNDRGPATFPTGAPATCCGVASPPSPAGRPPRRPPLPEW